VRSYAKQEAGEFHDLLLRLPREHRKSGKLHATLQERIFARSVSEHHQSIV
jgi:hypothetical protein